MTGPDGKLLRAASGAARYALTVLWLASGLAKLVGLANFRSVLELHGVLSGRAISLAWAVPVSEVVLGVVIFAAGTKPRVGVWRKAGAAGSAALLVLFCIYISRVPEATFRSVGCDCHGALGLTDIIGYPSRAGAIGFNLLMIGLSSCLFVNPIKSKHVPPTSPQGPSE
jgi:hypothetical protein